MTSKQTTRTHRCLESVKILAMFSFIAGPKATNKFEDKYFLEGAQPAKGVKA
jgi:hypothetical protein